jgi:hypothetical protein
MKAFLEVSAAEAHVLLLACNAVMWAARALTGPDPDGELRDLAVERIGLYADTVRDLGEAGIEKLGQKLLAHRAAA